jgi:hypothetical protein
VLTVIEPPTGGVDLFLGKALGYAQAARFLNAPKSDKLVEDILYMIHLTGRQSASGSGTLFASLVADIERAQLGGKNAPAPRTP